MSKVVLIVEDEAVLRDVYELVLSSKGFTVHTAHNGLEGLEKLKILQPDLVLLDMYMPVMDGKKFLRNFDKTKYPNTKIVMYSNLSYADTQEEMISLGAERFVLKSSLSPVELIQLVNETLNPAEVSK